MIKGAIERNGLPGWLEPVRDAAERVLPEQLSRFLPPREGGRAAAVLMLFGEGPDGPDLLLIERARSLRSHAGQPSFPGGALDPEDGDPDGPGPIAAALRESWEETGLDPAGVQVFAELPRLYIPVSSFVVTPVLGWWREESPVRPVDLGETGAVFRVSIADLADPANRVRLRHPSGHVGPAFAVAGRLVWGFTAGVIDRVLHHSGLELPWDPSRVVDLSDEALALVQGDLEHSRALPGSDAGTS
ncbi:NUDIX hydrolase [Kitasatospora sp. NPDC001159]